MVIRGKKAERPKTAVTRVKERPGFQTLKRAEVRGQRAEIRNRKSEAEGAGSLLSKRF
jgi:hypothetical protein